MRPWFNPTPNLSPRSGADRLLAAVVGVGLAIVGAAAVLAAVLAWILLMIVVATQGMHGTLAGLVICALIAMGGVGLAALAGGAWALLQIGSVRRALGLPHQPPLGLPPQVPLGLPPQPPLGLPPQPPLGLPRQHP
jgi:hypothetical protein